MTDAPGTIDLAMSIAADIPACTPDSLVVHRIYTRLAVREGWPAVSIRAMIPELYPLVRACVRAKDEDDCSHTKTDHGSVQPD